MLSFINPTQMERSVQTLFFLALIVVVTLTVLPGSSIKTEVSLNDKLLHFVAYFGLGILGGTGWTDRRRALLISMPLFGLALEGIQGGFVEGRAFDWYDGLANALGAFAGVAASLLSRRLLFAESRAS